jgi:hypothetical protein
MQYMPKRTRKESQKLKEKILALHNSGLNNSQVALKSKVTRQYVIKTIKESKT